MLRSIRALRLVLTALSFERSVMLGGAACMTGEHSGNHASTATDDAPASSEDCLHSAADETDGTTRHATVPPPPDHRCVSAQLCHASVLPASAELTLAAQQHDATERAPAATLVAGPRPAPDTPPPRA